MSAQVIAAVASPLLVVAVILEGLLPGLGRQIRRGIVLVLLLVIVGWLGSKVVLHMRANWTVMQEQGAQRAQEALKVREATKKKRVQQEVGYPMNKTEIVAPVDGWSDIVSVPNGWAYCLDYKTPINLLNVQTGEVFRNIDVGKAVAIPSARKIAFQSVGGGEVSMKVWVIDSDRWREYGCGDVKLKEIQQRSSPKTKPTSVYGRPRYLDTRGARGFSDLIERIRKDR